MVMCVGTGMEAIRALQDAVLRILVHIVCKKVQQIPLAALMLERIALLRSAQPLILILILMDEMQSLKETMEMSVVAKMVITCVQKDALKPTMRPIALNKKAPRPAEPKSI